MRRARASLVVLAFFACNRTPVEPVPVGEALLFVDTDMPVPKLVGHLRVDVYADDGTWYASRDFAALRPEDWPLSFAVYAPDSSSAGAALVRLRAYPEGKVRDYRGERYLARPDPASLCWQPNCTSACCAGNHAAVATPFATPECPDCPRLAGSGGEDATPASEPLPLLTIDQLVHVRLKPRRVGSARVLLAGACVGTMADLANRMTCVDTEGSLVDAPDSTLDPSTTLPGPSAVGAFAQAFQQDCAVDPRPAGGMFGGAPLHDEEVCVPGDVFVFGSSDLFGRGDFDDLPEHVAAFDPFLIDKYEVTVARFRRAMAQGFGGGTPIANDGPIPTSGTDFGAKTLCTWSDAPMGREEYPVNCVGSDVARAFCEFLGGDLPGEVQWEYVAMAAGRDAKTHYPWGDDQPSCSRAIYGCGPTAECGCFGPAPVTAADHKRGDVSVPPVDGGPGVVDLAGGLGEFTSDLFFALDANCWIASPLAAHGCHAPRRQSPNSIRGGWGWFSAVGNVPSATRITFGSAPELGFRCTRPAKAGS